MADTTFIPRVTHIVSTWLQDVNNTIYRFVRTGVGAVTRMLSDKVRDLPITPQDYGALANGVADDTLAIQNCINSNKAVYFPPGVYLCEGAVTLREDSKIYGAGTESVILRRGVGNTGQGLFYANSNSASAYVGGIEIRDMTFDGQVATLGFSEFRHLVALNGVRDAVVERVEFRGYRGDGLYFGSGTVAGDERHNVNVTVRNCVFDGVNSDNRNGISVIDGDGIRIFNNVFRNTTKSTMPAPIDVEPGANAFAVVRNVEIAHNRIESTNGTGGILVQIPVALTAPMSNVKIHHNSVTGLQTTNAIGIGVFTAETASSVSPMGVSVTDNKIDVDSDVVPLQFWKVRDLQVLRNTVNGGAAVLIGNVSVTPVTAMDVWVEGNNFYQCGNAEGAVLIASVNNLRFERNIINAPKAGTGTIGLHFHGTVPTTSSNVSVVGNTFIKGASQTESVHQSNHTFSPLTNIYRENVDVGGALISNRLGVCGNFTPKLWAVGNNTQIAVDVALGYFERTDRSLRVRFNFTVSAGGPGAGAGALWIGGQSSTCAAGVVAGNFPTGGSHLPPLNDTSLPTPIFECYTSGVDFSAGYTKCMAFMIQSTDVAIRIYEGGDNVAAQLLTAAALAANDIIAGEILYIIV